jgi:hypothetical protein
MMTAMNRRATAAWIVAAALGLSIAPAHAGPCTSKIAQFEQAVRQSAGNPNAGPMAPQSVGAQLDRQPTPASIKRAEQQAQATFAATLARAKRLDAQGNRTGCTRALAATTRAAEFHDVRLSQIIHLRRCASVRSCRAGLILFDHFLQHPQVYLSYRSSA